MNLQTNIKPFLNEDFLLENDYARELYHDYAAAMPIIDYHCHLPPDQAIASNQQYENLTQIWLHGDHYKWRAMRANGVAERYITGAGQRRGQVRPLGRHRALHPAQPALPLVAPGAEALLRPGRTALARKC
jgi:glucuronate isomerase